MNTGSFLDGTERSGAAVNSILKVPSSAATSVPCAIALLAGGCHHQHQRGSCTPRSTRHATFAPPIAAPVYAVALPVTTTGASSFDASFGVSSVTWNFGRLYSSTWKCVLLGRPSTWIDIVPVTRSRGAVNTPSNEP